MQGAVAMKLGLSKFLHKLLILPDNQPLDGNDSQTARSI